MTATACPSTLAVGYDIRRPISISDIRYLYPVSDIYIWPPISISDIWYIYPTSGILYPTSGIYIWPPISISDIRHLYPTSCIYIRHPVSISDILYLYPTSGIYIRHPVSISDVRYLYPTSDIDIRRLISISDIQYRYLYPFHLTKQKFVTHYEGGKIGLRVVRVVHPKWPRPQKTEAWPRKRNQRLTGGVCLGFLYRTSDIYIGRRI